MPGSVSIIFKLKWMESKFRGFINELSAHCNYINPIYELWAIFNVIKWEYISGT